MHKYLMFYICHKNDLVVLMLKKKKKKQIASAANSYKKPTVVSEQGFDILLVTIRLFILCLI